MQKEAGKIKIGVLSLQGGVIEHINHIKALNHNAIEVKKVEDLNDINGLIIPGGESTTIGKLLVNLNLLQPIKEKIASGMPVWGTCAGLILLAKNIENSSDKHLDLMNIKVRRNAYGTQINSFETYETIKEVSHEPIPLVFIRAPFVTEVNNSVEILCKVDEHIVAVKEKNMLATSFHPELTDNLEFHNYFLNMCK